MNIVIMGKSRCGKTTLANMICKSLAGYSKISLDYLVMAFKKVFTNLDLQCYTDKETQFTQFVEAYFDNCLYVDNAAGINYVLEGADLPQQTILRLCKANNTKVVFLGKTEITTQQFFEEIRQHESGLLTGGWTKKLDDKTLFSWCADWIKKSKQYKQFCEQNNIEFLDTSKNQTQVLQEFVEKIRQMQTIKK